MSKKQPKVKWPEIFMALRDRMRDGTLPPRRILLPAPLVVRDSTRR